MVIRYRYSEWDGAQEIPPLDPDDILNALTDDLMNFGDLQHALRNLLQRGMRNPMGDRTQGLRDMLQQLRQQRRQQLDRFNLSSAFEDIQKRLEEILEKERSTLDERTRRPRPGQRAGRVRGEQAKAPKATGERRTAMEASPASSSRAQSGQQARQAASRASAASRGQRGQQGQTRGSKAQQGQGQSGQQGGPAGQPASRAAADGQASSSPRCSRTSSSASATSSKACRKDLGGQMKELQNYEFMDPDAQAEFQELMEMLKQAMMETFFKDLQHQIANMTPEDMERMKDMIRDLNQMLQEKMQGGEPDFDAFMQQYGDLFGDNPPQNLDELVEQMQRQMSQMQNLLDSLPADMRQQLQDLLMDKIGDPELRDELADLPANLEYLYPQRDLRNQYPFRGEEELDLTEAMDASWSNMQDMDELERQLERTQYGGDIDDIDIGQAARAARRRGRRDAGPAQAVPRDPRGGRLHPQAAATPGS